jgi:hypothetical protein
MLSRVIVGSLTYRSGREACGEPSQPFLSLMLSEGITLPIVVRALLDGELGSQNSPRIVPFSVKQRRVVVVQQAQALAPLDLTSFGPKTELIFFSRDAESSYRMIAKLPIRPGSLWRAQSTVPFPDTLRRNYLADRCPSVVGRRTRQPEFAQNRTVQR